jgi:hypothetical protein
LNGLRAAWHSHNHAPRICDLRGPSGVIHCFDARRIAPKLVRDLRGNPSLKDLLLPSPDVWVQLKPWGRAKGIFARGLRSNLSLKQIAVIRDGGRFVRVLCVLKASLGSMSRSPAFERGSAHPWVMVHKRPHEVWVRLQCLDRA